MKWYFKTFRIYDSPIKDWPDKTVVDGSFDLPQGKSIVKAHNGTIDNLQAENKKLETELAELKERIEFAVDYLPECPDTAKKVLCLVLSEQQPTGGKGK